MDFCILSWFKANLKTSVYSLLSLFCILSFPAYSSTSLSTYGVINLAFILGLSIPVIVISLLYNFKGIFQLRYFVLLTLSLIGLIYFVAFGEQTQIILPLMFSILYLVFIYFSWAVDETDSIPTVTKISHSVVLVSSALYIAALYIYPNENNYIMWVFSSGTVVALIAVRIKCTTSDVLTCITHMSLFWLPVLYFSFIVFLWINQDIEKQWFMINAVACYILFFLASCWKIALARNARSSDQTEIFFPEQIELARSSSDSATNLPSQKQAFRHINKALKSHSKDKFTIIVFKPINFQQVNKILGYKNSDILLLQLAYCLQKSVENNPNLVNFNNSQVPIRIARLRGLHFLVVLQLEEKEKNRDILVEKLCQELTLAVPDAMSFKSFSLNFELTFGVSFINEYVNSLSQTVAHAEDALLKAESNQVLMSYFNKDEIIYTESHLLQMERLKQDITQDNLYWYVQPQTRVEDRKLVGFELLVQWHNENNIPIEFQGFIDTAEHSGEIYLLTKQMITRAFKLILRLQRVSNYERVSIKLLSQYLLEPDLVSFIEKQIATYNVPAKYLIIELPEKVVLSASERAKNIIDELKSLNVNIAISDFSGSYESLRYIRKMAVHQVKIDCERISEAVDDPENAIITSLIDLTKKMNLPLIGTSINNKSTEKAFTQMGGELAQGEVVDRGVTSDNIGSWVTTWNNLYNPV
ncbi:GGDEF domain-containing phosphodiesterase [Pseudocolwellia sp. AS88]